MISGYDKRISAESQKKVPSIATIRIYKKKRQELIDELDNL